MKYQLAKPTIYRYSIKKSAFICHLYPITNKFEAKSLLREIKKQFPDARHICYGFLVGNHSGMGDDGEPSGTAGKPIFQSLQHQQLEDTLAIVVRYFGGIKLGAGGLIRAYATAVREAVKQAHLIKKIDYTTLKIESVFALENKIRHHCKQHNISIIDCQYLNQLEIYCKIPQSQSSDFKQQLVTLCAGEVKVYCE